MASDMNWPDEMRLAAILFELPGGPKGADIFVAEDPPGEFDDECLYVPKEQLEATRQQLDRLLEAVETWPRYEASYPLSDGSVVVADVDADLFRTALEIRLERKEADDHA